MTETTAAETQQTDLNGTATVERADGSQIPSQDPSLNEKLDDALAEMFGAEQAAKQSQPETVDSKPPETQPDDTRSLLDDDAGTETATTTATETLTDIKALAEKAGVRVTDLTFTIDDGDGKGPQQVSYADLKAGYAGAEKLAAERMAFETAQSEESQKLLAARRDFENIVSMIPPESWPENLKAALAEQSRQTADYESRMTLQAIPAWKDAETMQADRADMQKYLEQWGYSAVEVDNIFDHRALAFVRYHTRLVKRVAELEAAQKPTQSRRGSQKGRGNKVAELRGQVTAGNMTGDQAAARFLKSIGL